MVGDAKKANADCNLSFGTGTVICNDAEMKGDITFGSGTVVHPKAKILAESGPIVFGENNLVEETAEIINRHPEVDGKPHTMIIGNNNVFELGSKTFASRMGNSNVIEVRGVLGKEVELGNGCVIGAKCEVHTSQGIPDNSVFYGSECRQRIANVDKLQGQQGQMDFLRKALPNYHYLASKKA